jgi:hypothetical protein
MSMEYQDVVSVCMAFPSKVSIPNSIEPDGSKHIFVPFGTIRSQESGFKKSSKTKDIGGQEVR